VPDSPDEAPDGTVAASPPPERAARRLPPPRRAAPPASPSSPGGRGLTAPDVGEHASRAGEQADSAPRGGQDARKAWKKALADLHAAQRRGKGRYRARDATPRYQAGMTRMPPPQPPGSTP
jgi:hypothetical protein